MSHVFPCLIDRFMTMYGRPKSDNPAGYIEEFAKALSGFSEPVLKLAADRILQNHAYPSWPSLGECVKICREAALILNPRSAPEHQKLEQDIDKPPVDEATAKHLLASFTSSIPFGNDFPAILSRCPIGGQIDVSKPWGKEVTDKKGNVVPIRQKRERAA